MENKNESIVHQIMQDALLDMGVSPALLGFEYLIASVEYAFDHRDVLNGSITKVLYPTVAEKFGTASNRVERAMRHAIERAFDCAPMTNTKKYFGNCMNAGSGKVNNSTFVACMIRYVDNVIKNKEDKNEGA